MGRNLVVPGDLIIKIYRRLAKKRYLKGKYTYEHERIYVPIPKQFHDKIEPFLNKKLKIEVKPANGGLKIIFTPHENVSAPRKHPVKTAPKLTPNPHF